MVLKICGHKKEEKKKAAEAGWSEESSLQPNHSNHCHSTPDIISRLRAPRVMIISYYSPESAVCQWFPVCQTCRTSQAYRC